MVNMPTAEEQQYPSSQLEVDRLGLIETFNSTWAGPSDCSPPSDLDLFDNDQSMRHSPPRTPGLAPKHQQYTNLSQFHGDRAQWHEDAARWHRQQAAYLLEQSSKLFDLTTPEEKVSLTNSSCDTISSHGEHQSGKKHSRSSRISRHGAVQKMPAHISKVRLFGAPPTLSCFLLAVC